MKPTEVLKQEHRVIETVLDCVDVLIGRARSTGKVDPTQIEQVVDFFRSFADHCHHGKEEEVLFALLETRGLIGVPGPTLVMKGEHELLRANLRRIAAEVTQIRQGEPAATLRFAHEAEHFTKMLRLHIEKEDHCLFPMVDQVLSPELSAQVLDGFAHRETKDVGEGVHEHYLHWVEQITHALGVARPKAPTVSGSSPCCHH